MEVTKKKRLNNRDGKKITVTFGGVGGIGGVVLFVGGALVTAAFASAFVLKRIRRRSAEDRRDRRPAEIEKPRVGEEGAEEGREIHIYSDNNTSLSGEQSEEETERDDDSHVSISSSSMQAEIPGTENSGHEVPSEKEETLISTPENEIVSSDSLTVENPEKIHWLGDEDSESEVPKEESSEILGKKDRDAAAAAINRSQSTYEESIEILNCDNKEVNPEDNSAAIGTGLEDAENIEPPKNENVEKTKAREFIGDDVEMDAKKHDEATEKIDDLVEDKHEDITNDVIVEKSVVCESEHEEPGDCLDPVSKQEDTEDIYDDDDDDGEDMETESSLEVESSDGTGDSSLESNSDVVFATEYLKESSPLEPRINAGKVEGKMMQEGIIMGGDNGKCKEEDNSTKRRMIVAVLLMVSWFVALWLLLGQALFHRLVDDGSLGIKFWV